MKHLMNRRRALETIGLAGIGAVAGSATPARAQTAKRPSAVGPLPPRTEFLIRGAYVMTMDPSLGDLSNGDVHVRNGAIAAVGHARRRV